MTIAALYDEEPIVLHSSRLPEYAGDLVLSGIVLPVQATNQQVLDLFSKSPELFAIVVEQDDLPVGLINRNSFHAQFARPYVREHFGSKSCVAFMDKEPLLVESETPIREIARLAATIDAKLAYEGFIVVRDGRTIGVCDGVNLLRTLGRLQEAQYNQLQTQNAALIQNRDHLEREIAERKEAEAAVRASEAVMTAMFEQAAVGIMRLADSGRLLQVNQKLCELLDHGRIDLLGLRLDQLTHLEDVEASVLWQRKMQSGEVNSYNLEQRLLRRDNSELWAHLAVARIDDAEGKFLNSVCVAVDMTERRKVLELTDAKLLAEEANRAKSAFLASMSHELRTPMHAILAYATLAKDRLASGNTEKLPDYLSRICVSGERLTHLINDLLDLSKLEAGKMAIERRPVDLTCSIHDVITELSPLFAERNIDVDCPAPTCEVVISGDATRIAQVLRNLLSNAIKFSPNGARIEVTIDACKFPTSKKSEFTHGAQALRIAVADCGVGIPESELESVFDKFVQSSRTRNKTTGTGLGLAICKEIVHAHGGLMRASNRQQGGALFEVYIPTPAQQQSASHPRLVAMR
jgi:PAS domain S-box-containing protein